MCMQNQFPSKVKAQIRLQLLYFPKTEQLDETNRVRATDITGRPGLTAQLWYRYSGYRSESTQLNSKL